MVLVEAALYSPHKAGEPEPPPLITKLCPKSKLSIPIVELILDELWDIYEWEIEKFSKIIKVTSLIVLILFYLGAYLILVWKILSPFLVYLGS